MNINTQDVLDAAKTKWNFLPFKPGLVGGYCIGVDPYYLAQKAQEFGYHPEIILEGRRMNDSMGQYVASETIKLMLHNDLKVKNSNILVLGFTFKENCPDVRNIKVIDVVKNLENFGAKVCVYDPWANPQDVVNEYKINTLKELPKEKFEAIILAVSHREFNNINISDLLIENGVIYDVKGVLERHNKIKGL